LTHEMQRLFANAVGMTRINNAWLKICRACTSCERPITTRQTKS